MDVKDAYRLVRLAEMEHDRATFKILYVIYGKTHNASLKILGFWLKRVVDIAVKVDHVYHCTRPSFPLSLIGRLQDGLPPSLIHYIDSLRTIADRVLQSPSPLEHQVVTSIQEAPQLVDVAVIPSEEVNNALMTIVCSGPDRDEGADVRNKIDKAIKTHGEIILSKVITRWANRFFPEIHQQIQASQSHYQPIRRIEIKHKRWQKVVSVLALKYFGADVIIIVDQ